MGRGSCRAIAAILLSLSALSRAGEALDPVEVSLEANRLAEVSFEEMVAREQRLIAVSTRIRLAGVELCSDVLAPVLGLEVMRADDLPRAYINPAIRRFGVSDKLRAVWILAGSASARAGLQPGDVIVSIEGFEVKTEQDVNKRRAASGATSLRFAIERDGTPHEVEVPYEPGCYVQPMLSLSPLWNAYASRHDTRIVLFSEMLREVKSDDELATVFGHELAHIVLNHQKSSPRAEAEADYLGLYFAARAGYDAEAGAAIWRRLSRTRPWDLVESETHPSGPERAVADARALDEIRRKRQAGEPLRPERSP